MTNMTTRESFQNNFNIATASFKWEQVEEILNLLDVKWYISKDKYATPTVSEIIEKVREQFDTVLNIMIEEDSNDIVIYCLGFCITLEKEAHTVCIQFIPCEGTCTDEGTWYRSYK